jgi:FtsZ-interacting cell division protein YlmF
MRLEWALRFSEDVAAEVGFYAEKEEAKTAQKAAKKRDREARRAKKEAKKKQKEEKAARKKKEKKNGVGLPTIAVDSSSSSFEWTSTPVSSTTPNSSDFDWDSE